MKHPCLTPILAFDAEAALQAELAQAARDPALRPWVQHPGPDLGPRFVGHWRRLRALPRRTRRSLQRRWKRSLAAIALLMALGQLPALAATIPVNGTTCILVDAIRAANTDASVGGCSAGSGADTLELVPGSTHGLTMAADTAYDGGNGLPLVTSKITIEGHGSTVERTNTRYDDPQFRLLAVSVTGDVTLKGLTLTKGCVYRDHDGAGAGVFNAGMLTLSNSSLVGNGHVGACYFDNTGGGVHNEGMLILTDSTVSGNVAFGGGGGVFNTGTATLINSTVSGNFSIGSDNASSGPGGGLGGGVHNSGMLTLIHSTVTGNGSGEEPASERGGSGGGIFNSGILNIADSTVSNNNTVGTYYGLGGGIRTAGTATITNSTVSANRSIAQYNYGYGGGRFGGGIFNDGHLTVVNSTVSGNRSSTFGGTLEGGGAGITNGRRSTLRLVNSTVSGNYGGGVQNGTDSNYHTSTDGTVNLDHTLVSGNTPSEVINVTGNTVVANDFNVFGSNGNPGVSGFSPGPTDIIPAGPLDTILAPLADNGGPTETHALVAGSPAVDAVERGCPPPATDQRGFGRPMDGDGDGTARCDAGAFELAARPLPTCENAEPTRGCIVNGVAHQLCTGTSRNDEIFGTPRNDIIFGSGGNDRINGLGGNDLLCGGNGHDILRGKQGQDRIFGGPGNDTLQGGSGDDELSGEAGRDQLFGDRGDDALDGGTGRDTCRGDANGPLGDRAIACETVTGVP